MGQVQFCLEIIFWIVFALLFHGYIGIYIVLWLGSIFIHRSKSTTKKTELPTVSLLIAAYNEEDILEGKIRNSLSQDYPRELLDIVVASDCSSDRTVEIARSFADQGVRTIEFLERKGKNGIDDAVIGELPGEVVMVTDANVILAPDAVRKMAEAYCDPSVGAACCDYQVVSPPSGKNMNRETTYRSYENLLKKLMGKFGCVIGTDGAFYSLRRTLFKPLGDKPLQEDVIVPLNALAMGYKVVYCEGSCAIEETHPTIEAEYRRRVRMTGYNLNSLPRLLKETYTAGFGPVFIAISYKVLRWFSPYLLGLLYLLSILLYYESKIYLITAVIFTTGLVFALIGLIGDKFDKRLGIATDAYHFVSMNIAAYFGLIPWLRGVKNYWNPRGM